MRRIYRDPECRLLLKRSSFIYQGFDLFVNVPDAVCVGMANETLDLCEYLENEGKPVNKKEKKKAERIVTQSYALYFIMAFWVSFDRFSLSSQVGKTRRGSYAYISKYYSFLRD